MDNGMLWNRSLVMYDRETESSWSHILGEAMDGKMKGATLDHVPSDRWTLWYVFAIATAASHHLASFVASYISRKAIAASAGYWVMIWFI